MSRAPTPEPPEGATGKGTTPGVRLKKTGTLRAELYLDGNQSLTQFHRAALDAGLEEVVFEALRAMPGTTHQEFRQQLEAVWEADDRIEGTPLDGALSHTLASAAVALRTPDADEETETNHDSSAVESAQRVLRRLGSGNVDNVPSPREDVYATGVLLREAGEAIPTHSFEVHLGVEWAGRRADQRAAVLEWLAELWPVHEVALVTSRAATARLLDAHRDLLPAHLTQACKRRCLPADADGDREDGEAEATARAQQARSELSISGRKTGAVAALAATETHALTYDELADALALDSPSDGNLYQVVKRLEEAYGLVERLPRPDGTTIVSLTPAGLTYVEDVYREHGRQTSLPGTVAGVSQTPQISPPMPCEPAQGREGEGVGADADRNPAAEAAATEAAAARPAQEWTQGLVAPEFMQYSRSVPLRAAAEQGDVVLQNARIRRDDVDPRVPRISIDDGDLLVEPGAYQNPLQFATTIAHGLAWPETRDRVLRPSDLDALLDGELDVETLRDATGLGWLSDDSDGHDVSEAIDEALETLLFETGAYAGGDHDVVARAGGEEGFDESMLARLDGLDPDEDRELTASEHRSLITSYALGLATTLVHLVELTGIDVVLGVRIPECTRHFGTGDDENSTRRETLVEHLTTLSTLWSRYGAFNGFKQLRESRERKRSNADPNVDAADPFGTLRAGIVVVGRGVESLADDLRDALESERDLHPDAPEFNVAIDVKEGTSIGASLQTARRLLEKEKRLTPTPEAVSALAAFAAEPWAVATAIHRGLERESSRRRIHLDEVRRALAQLPWQRLVEEPESDSSTKRRAVEILLEADAPISAAEMARRGGPSTQSWRNHRDRLLDLGLVEETSNGWRLTLPFRHERDATATGVTDREDGERPEIPWFWQADATDVPGDLGREKRAPGDVIDWLLIERGLLEDTSRLRDPGDPVGQWAEAYYAGEAPEWDAMQSVCAEFEVPWRVIVAGCRLRAPSPASHTAAVGPSLKQTAIPGQRASLAAD